MKTDEGLARDPHGQKLLTWMQLIMIWILNTKLTESAPGELVSHSGDLDEITAFCSISSGYALFVNIPSM